LRLILILFFLFLTNSAFSQSSLLKTTSTCSDGYDYDWRVDSIESLLGMNKAVYNAEKYPLAAFKFKSKTEKSIKIKTIYLKTADNKIMRSKDYNVTLKPFEILELELSLNNLNRELMKFASVSCEYGIGKDKNSESTGSKDFLKKIIGQ